MKKLALTASALLLLLALAFMALWWGERVFTKRLTKLTTVANYQWQLPPDKPSLVTDDLAVEGINVTLRENGLDGWEVVPAWPDSTELLRRNVINANRAGLSLSNRSSGEGLHATVELDPTNRVLHIRIYRPK